MPPLSDHQSAQTAKVLFLGDSGTGKTGALASLAEAGYNLRIIDFDNGLDILANLLRSKSEALARVKYVTCTDQFSAAGTKVVPIKACAWTRLVELLNEWVDGTDRLGKVTDWTPNEVLVLDSLTFAGKSAVRFIQALNSRLSTLPQIQDYNEAQRLVENMIGMLYGAAIKCNVIVLAHVREIARSHMELDSKGREIKVEEQGSRKGFAETGTGNALSPVTGRYFNAVLLADIVGSGPQARRVIRTVPHLNIGLKNPAPGIVKPEYNLSTGLAEYFAAVRSQGPNAQTTEKVS